MAVQPSKTAGMGTCFCLLAAWGRGYTYAPGCQGALHTRADERAVIAKKEQPLEQMQEEQPKRSWNPLRLRGGGCITDCLGCCICCVSAGWLRQRRHGTDQMQELGCLCCEDVRSGSLYPAARSQRLLIRLRHRRFAPPSRSIYPIDVYDFTRNRRGVDRGWGLSSMYITVRLLQEPTCIDGQ